MRSTDVQTHPISGAASGSLLSRWQHREPVCVNVQRVLADALVNPGFRARLLSCPAEAIADYDLTSAERRMLASVRATTLPEFAAAVEAWRSTRAATVEEPESTEMLASA